MELFSALIGAIVGGGATFAASWWQTRRVLEHEITQARMASDEERRDHRLALSRTIALDLLEVLYRLEDALPNLHLARLEYQEQGKVARGALDSLRHSEQVETSLLIPELRHRWNDLRSIATELAYTPVRDSGHAAAMKHSDAPWDEKIRERAVKDVKAYADYVRQTILSVVDDSPLPSDAPRPHLSRQEMSVWVPVAADRPSN